MRTRAFLKKSLIQGALLVTFFLLLPSVAGSVSAAKLQFEAAQTTISSGGTIDVKVIVDGTPEKITSTDAYVTYDSTILQAQSVTDGSFFPTVFNDITTQRVYLAGLVDDPATFKEGSGTVAIITFKALKNGSTTLAFKCQTGAPETSKIIKNDFNATNIIECDKNGTLTITVGTSVVASPTPTTTVTTTSTSTPTTLPQSGAYDKLVLMGVLGSSLLLVGVSLRFLI